MVETVMWFMLSLCGCGRGCGLAGSQFKDEDDLTRKLKLEKEYQVFVKMDKRVPGTK